MNVRKTAAEILAIENQGRPPVQIWGSGGMASSTHPEATESAVDILRQGGNAIDAAVALSSTLVVTNQDMTGMGGDSAWLIYWARTGEFFYLDGYGKVPAGLTPAVLEKRFGLTSESDPAVYREEPPGVRNSGIIVSIVPGTPSAWAEIANRFGTMPFQKILARAIAIADGGFPVNRTTALQLGKWKPHLGQFESSRKIFFRPDGDVLHEGDTLIQKDLAQTLMRYACEGRADFYTGKTARALVDYSNSHGGVFTLEDLAGYQAVWRPALSTDYRGFQVVAAGPPTSGIHMLQEMNILENFDLASLGYHSPESLHVLIEAAKLARADRRGFAGDPDFVEIPIAKLLDRGYAAERARLIEFGTAKCARPGVESTGSETTHFAVIDGEGNIVSTTQTVGSMFGCGEVIEGTGMVLNDRSWWMALRDSPNVVAPGHRANIGHSPMMVLSNGRPFMALGSPGGDGIVQYVMQTLVNVIDYGFDIQDAIEAPRFRSTDLCSRVSMERRISQASRDTLRQWGHEITDLAEWTREVGGVEGFSVDLETGNILGGYDPRRNSLAGGIL